MNKNETDRRISRTRRILQDALFSLMQEKQYSRITIQNIIDRADVGRSTFYSHYETKDDLLFGCIENLLECLNYGIIKYFDMEEDRPRIRPIAELFDHIKENSRLIKGLMKAESSEPFFDKIQTYWNKNIGEYLQTKLKDSGNPKIPIAIMANHITSTLINLLKWWINNKTPYSSVQMDQYFQYLIEPCIDSMYAENQPKPCGKADKSFPGCD